MSFIWPAMLGLLALVPLCVAAYVWLQRRRQRVAARYGSLWPVHAALGRGPGVRRHLPAALFLLALTVLVVALARPEAAVSLPRLEGTVILAFDVSASMAADDVAPTRMEAAKAAAQAFVQRQPASVQIGVVAFSNSGLAVQLPTSDQEAVLAAIQRLAPQRGTSLGHGLAAALNAIAVAYSSSGTAAAGSEPAEPLTDDVAPEATYDSAVIVLLSDGENTQAPDPLEVALAAAEHRVRVYTVGLGSAEGTSLQIDGFTVHTQLDEAMLRQIAQLTEGTYYAAADQADLAAIYDTVAKQLVIRPEKTEVTSLFAGAGVLFLLLGGVLSLLWFGRVP